MIDDTGVHSDSTDMSLKLRPLDSLTLWQLILSQAKEAPWGTLATLRADTTCCVAILSACKLSRYTQAFDKHSGTGDLSPNVCSLIMLRR